MTFSNAESRPRETSPDRAAGTNLTADTVSTASGVRDWVALARRTPDAERISAAANLASWRARILETILSSAAFLGVIAYLPSVALAYRSGLWSVIIADTIAYGLIVGLAVWRTGPYVWRAGILTLLWYGLSLFLILAIGAPGGGLLWLTTFPVFAGLLLGTRAAMLSVGLTAATCAGLAVLTVVGSIQWIYPETTVTEGTALFIVNASNAVLLALITALPVALLLQALSNAVGSLTQEVAERQRAEADRARAEAQLRQSQRLESLGKLAGGIAHDFNNLLVPIMAHADELKRDAAIAGAHRERLADVARSAERARDLVRRILVFSRQMVVKRGQIRLDDAIREAVALLRAGLPRNIAIEMSLTATRPVVTAEAGELNQVLMNLGTNAAHAMKDQGGLLMFRLFDAPNDRLKVQVEDTGVGMDPTTLEKAFDPFFTTKGVGEGTGLGLATVHGIVNDLGGQITLSSAPGQGTRVDVELPRSAGPEPEPARTKAQAKQGRGEEILVVDDEPAVLNVCRTMLQRLGYAVTGAGSGEEALRLLRAERDRWALVLTDNAMPGMSGLAFAAALRADNFTVPIVLITGRLEHNEDVKRISLGIKHVLSKPYQRAELAALVADALAHTSDHTSDSATEPPER